DADGGELALDGLFLRRSDDEVNALVAVLLEHVLEELAERLARFLDDVVLRGTERHAVWAPPTRTLSREALKNRGGSKRKSNDFWGIAGAGIRGVEPVSRVCDGRPGREGSGSILGRTSDGDGGKWADAGVAGGRWSKVEVAMDFGTLKVIGEGGAASRPPV